MTTAFSFVNRCDAGLALAARLEGLRDANRVVIGIANGGTEVALEVARSFRQRLASVVVQSLVSETGNVVGAIAEDEAAIVDRYAAAVAGWGHAELARRIAEEARTSRRRAYAVRRGRPLEVSNRPVTLVTEGVTNGLVERAALRMLRRLGATEVVLATPAGPVSTLAELSGDFDAVASVVRSTGPPDLPSLYEDHRAMSDDEASSFGRPALTAWTLAIGALLPAPSDKDRPARRLGP